MNDDDSHLSCIRHSGAYMSFTEHSVTKKQSRIRAQLEYEKTIRGETIGHKTALFRVPKITDYDPVSGLIKFERIYGLRSLAEVLSTSMTPEKIIKNVAYALASIHNHQLLPNDKAIFIEFDSINYTKPIFLHGDYSTKNIYLDDNDNLVILDWSITAWVGGDGSETGPCYLDLSIFVLSLFIHRPFEEYRLKNPGNLVSTLLDYYCSKYQHEFDLEEFKQFFPQLITLFLRAPRTLRAKLRVVACYPTIFAAKKYVREL